MAGPHVSDRDIEALIPLVESLAWTRVRRAPPWVDHDDLVQAGLEGVCQASQRWTPAGGAGWATFAYQRAHGAICDYLRSARPGGRNGLRWRDECPHGLRIADGATDCSPCATKLVAQQEPASLDLERRNRDGDGELETIADCLPVNDSHERLLLED